MRLSSTRLAPRRAITSKRFTLLFEEKELIDHATHQSSVFIIYFRFLRSCRQWGLMAPDLHLGESSQAKPEFNIVLNCLDHATHQTIVFLICMASSPLPLCIVGEPLPLWLLGLYGLYLPSLYCRRSSRLVCRLSFLFVLSPIPLVPFLAVFSTILFVLWPLVLYGIYSSSLYCRRSFPLCDLLVCLASILPLCIVGNPPP